MLQMFCSVEVIPSSTVWCMIKHNHLCLRLQGNFPFLFSFFRNCAFTYYLCSTDYWNSGWRNAISLLLEMNQFEMPEVFGKTLLEMPVVLKMSSVSTHSIYLRKQRHDIVFDWRKKCAPPPLSNLMAMSTLSNQRNLWGFDHKYTVITILQELQSLHLWVYLKIIELHVLS